MTTTTAQPPAPADDEIDLRQLAAALQRHWRLIAKVAGGTLLLSALYAFLTPKLWEGEFQIVLAQEESGGGGGLAQLAASNPMLAGMLGGRRSNLETEVKILESPSVLKPVFDFVRSSKQRAGSNVENLRFSDWVKKNVEIKLEKGTSVLNITYTDTDQSLVLPVIQRISREYQIYSGRDRKRDMANAVDYLKASIATLAPKAEASMQRAQAFALSNGLGLQDGLPASSATSSSSSSADRSVEGSRQQAQAQVALLQQQLADAKAAGSRVLFQAPQLEANAELYATYQDLEAELNKKRSLLRDNDELIRNLQRQRQSLITTLNRQTIGLLQGQLATAQAALQASSRPKDVVLKHRELVRQAVRDERTLVELENQLQLAQLEQAKSTDPWELISTPTLLDRPVAPRKGRILALGLLAGLLAGSSAALVVDRRSGRVFSQDELQSLLPYPLLARLNAADPEAWPAVLQLLVDGPLASATSVALIPVGSIDQSAMAVQATLRLLLPEGSTINLCHDLHQAASHERQLLLARLGAARREQLQQLQQNLQLQAKPVAGLVLL